MIVVFSSSYNSFCLRVPVESSYSQPQCALLFNGVTNDFKPLTQNCGLFSRIMLHRHLYADKTMFDHFVSVWEQKVLSVYLVRSVIHIWTLVTFSRKMKNAPMPYLCWNSHHRLAVYRAPTCCGSTVGKQL